MSFRIGLLLFSLFIISCRGYQENALVGDMQNDSLCTPGGCADSEATANKMTVKLDVSAVTTAKAESKLDISGRCYASTYEDNAIDITVYEQKGGTNVAVANNMYSIYGLNSGYAGIKCINGRFNAALKLTDLGSPIYQIKVEIRGIKKDSLNTIGEKSNQWTSMSWTRAAQ